MDFFNKAKCANYTEIVIRSHQKITKCDDVMMRFVDFFFNVKVEFFNDLLPTLFLLNINHP